MEGVMEELRALREDVEKLQRDRVVSSGASVTLTTNAQTIPTQGTSTEQREHASAHQLAHTSEVQITDVASPASTSLPLHDPGTSTSYNQGTHTRYQPMQGCATQPTAPLEHCPTQRSATFPSMVTSPPGAPVDYTTSAVASLNPTMEADPVPASTLPDIDIVPMNIKKDIWRGKDVNLAVLLLPIKDRKYATSDRDMQIGGEIFTL